MRRGLMAVVMLSLLLSGWVGSVSALAEGTRFVHAWATIGTTQPAVGCVVPLNIEVRQNGDALSGADVLAGLVIAGEIYSSDRGVTGADGVARLSVSMAGGAVGAAGRVEVNVSGSYLGHLDVVLTRDGACEGASRMLTTTTEIWLTDAMRSSALAVNTPSGPADTSAAMAGTSAVAAPMPTNGVAISVPTYVQQRNLSCEYASLTIATAALGNPVSEFTFDSLVGWNTNPHWGYRGDINGWWGNTTDYGVYAEPLASVLPQLGFTAEVFYGQGDASSLINRIDRGMPTLVWLGLWGETGVHETTADGTQFKLVSGAHVVVAYGYDDTGVYTSDPALGQYRFFDWSTFMSMWNVFNGMALGVAIA